MSGPAIPYPPLPIEEDDLPCGACGNQHPVRLGSGGCDGCRTFPRCVACGTWSDLVPSRTVNFADGTTGDICDTCWERIE